MPPRSLARQFSSFALVATLGAGATGCTWIDDFFDESVTLSEFAPTAARVTFEMGELQRTQLELQPQAGLCPTMKDDIEASVADKPMDVFIKGGKQPSGTSWICGAPTFRRNVAAEDLGATSTKFVVADDTDKVTVVASQLLLDRSLGFDPDVDPVPPVEAGIERAFVWSTSTDVIDPALLEADFVYDDAMLALTAEIETRVDGSLVFIRLPKNAPTGAGKLMVDVTAAVPVETCDGVASCSANVHAPVELVVDVIAAQSPNP
jgi:hypothetical protein